MSTFTLSKKTESLFSDYCQFLVSSFTNFTQTYFADHTEKWSHDQLNRFLRNESIPSSELWASVKDDIEFDEDGYIIRHYINLIFKNQVNFWYNKGIMLFGD